MDAFSGWHTLYERPYLDQNVVSHLELTITTEAENLIWFRYNVKTVTVEQKRREEEEGEGKYVKI